MKKFIITTCVLCLTFCVLASPVNAADEEALMKVWKIHTDTPDDHMGVIKACVEFKKKNPTDSFASIVQTICSWHLFKINRADAAQTLLKPIESKRTSSIQKAASNIAKAWLTRIDRETVKAALQKVYARDVGFPVSLTTLKEFPELKWPTKDRWGSPWLYRLVGFKHLKNLPKNQKYSLSSRMLGDSSDMKAGIKIPYGSNITINPIKITSYTSSRKIVEFEAFVRTSDADPTARSGPGVKAVEKMHLSVGGQYKGITFAYIGKSIVILADVNHWGIYRKP